jgi:hypothetical protein
MFYGRHHDLVDLWNICVTNDNGYVTLVNNRVIRNRKSKDRKHNGLKEKDKRTNSHLQNITQKPNIEQHEPYYKSEVTSYLYNIPTASAYDMYKCDIPDMVFIRISLTEHCC